MEGFLHLADFGPLHEDNVTGNLLQRAGQNGKPGNVVGHSVEGGAYG